MQYATCFPFRLIAFVSKILVNGVARQLMRLHLSDRNNGSQAAHCSRAQAKEFATDGKE